MSPKVLKAAEKHLLTDVRLAPFIKRVGKPDILERGDTYVALSRAIVYQQLSGKAAGTIWGRYCANFKEGTPNPKEFFRKKREVLMKAGLSNQKMNYLYDLSCKFRDGFITPEKFPEMSDEEIREHLVAVKGIGVWTADMFLIFTLGRTDVLPTLDLGIKKGFQKLFNMRALPDHAKMEKLAKPWQPYRSVACWYLWRLADEGNKNRPAA